MVAASGAGSSPRPPQPLNAQHRSAAPSQTYPPCGPTLALSQQCWWAALLTWPSAQPQPEMGVWGGQMPSPTATLGPASRPRGTGATSRAAGR